MIVKKGNLLPGQIYNVLIGGWSIGLTKDYNEACFWIHHSMFKGSKEIRIQGAPL